MDNKFTILGKVAFGLLNKEVQAVLPRITGLELNRTDLTVFVDSPLNAQERAGIQQVLDNHNGQAEIDRQTIRRQLKLEASKKNPANLGLPDRIERIERILGIEA